MARINSTKDNTIKVTKDKDNNNIIISCNYINITLDIYFLNCSIYNLLIDPSIDDIIEAIKQYRNRVDDYHSTTIEELYQFKDTFKKH